MDLEPGRELDALVAEKVMGAECSCDKPTKEPGSSNPYGMQGFCDVHGGVGCPDYSTSISAAWEVVEKLCQHDKFIQLTRGSWNQKTNSWTTWIVEVDGPSSTERVEAPTAPLAICRAALKAIDVISL